MNDGKPTSDQKIKDLLYESRARMLLSGPALSKARSSVRWLYIGVASIAAAIAVYMLYPSAAGLTERADLIAEVYTMPPIPKSRSATQDIIDAYSADIASGDYAEALDALSVPSLSERDRYYKVHLLVADGQYTEAQKLLKDVIWDDSYYQEESEWLRFLIMVHNGTDAGQLSELVPTLPIAYQPKATTIIEQLR